MLFRLYYLFSQEPEEDFDYLDLLRKQVLSTIEVEISVRQHIISSKRVKKKELTINNS